ncbi:extracellular solute-binding protein [Clostridium sp. D53t1_180928_C8]|uniref:ABC transporter substrate-binding protein n=1 Tax=Clostridium sp. D53t1_180928_C8 TaxID=2787101 RepID=UPI0018ABFBF1|nr:extracellular solute-binding protein [Clostridium sp. D53t1_180928_C8]
MGRNFKKMLSILLSLTLMLSIAGCSKGEGKSSMGRYVEERYDVPEGVNVQSVSLLENDKIGMIAYSNENWKPVAFISEDGGKTWAENSIELPKEEGKETYTNNIGYLSNGKILLSYYFQEPMPDNPPVGEGENGAIAEEGVVNEEVYKEPEFKYAVVDTDGTLTDIELDLSVYNDDDESMGAGYNNFKCSTNGDVFFTVGSNSEKVVQFDGETFKEKNIYESNEWINDFFLVGESLIIYEFDSITEYDTTNGKEKGNLEALEKETIAENSNYYPTFLNAGSKDKLYYYTTLGLYEYNMKTEKVKQLVDSAISSFGDNEMSITSFVEKSNGEFLTTFTDWSNPEAGTSIINYAYDENIPSVPENQLVVYSLLENHSIRQAISSYAKEHPDTYVKYEIGLTYGDGVTQSDALKTLNTEIMAGNGPDVIILDGLSAESYIEKGLLEDISDVINPLVEDGSVFKNIAEAYTVDGKIYQFPTSFKFPMLFGNKDDISNIKGLDSLVELTKKLSTQTQKRVFSNYFDAKSLVYSLYYLYGNDWLNDDDTINEEALTNFFNRAKEMYAALQENEASYAKFMEDKYANSENIDNNFGVDSDVTIDQDVEDSSDEEFTQEDYEEMYGIYDLQYYLNPSIYADMFLFEDASSLAYGGIDGADGYSSLITAMINRSEMDYKILTRDDKSIFTGSNIIGINAKGKNKEEAKEVVKQLLSDKIQKQLYGNGLPVNKETLVSQFSMEKHEGYEPEFDEATNHYVSYTSMWADELGNEKEIKVLLANEEDVNKLIAQIEGLNTATTLNTVLLTEVAKQFAAFAQGEISLDDAISKVVDNLDLYLSE